MKFDDLDRALRVYETAHDHCVLPGLFMVARLDGRSFTRLTKETHDFDAPFDVRFRDLMLSTGGHLMECGFRVTYGYVQSDEISLLLARDDETFGRKTRKIVSVLAGEASAHFSLALGAPAVFDCRVSQLPDRPLVVQYFRWRQEDAHRNSLHGHCYWLLRNQGRSAKQATRELLGRSVSAKNELLFRNGIQFNELPAWQRRGAGLVWESFEKPAVDPRTGAAVTATRRRLTRDLELPMRDAYDAYVRSILAAEDPAATEESA